MTRIWMQRLFLLIVAISLAVFAQENVNVNSEAEKILDEQTRELSCTLIESELVEVAKSVLDRSNVSYESFTKDFDVSRRLIAALRALMERKDEADAIFKEFEIEKDGIVTIEKWKNFYSQRYTTKEKIDELEKIIPKNEEDFYRMLSASFKVPAERWLLAQRIIQDYDKRHGDNANDSDESKLSAWWTERLKARIANDEMRSEICKHLVIMNLHSIKYGRQYEESLKGKLQEQGK